MDGQTDTHGVKVHDGQTDTPGVRVRETMYYPEPGFPLPLGIQDSLPKWSLALSKSLRVFFSVFIFLKEDLPVGLKGNCRVAVCKDTDRVLIGRMEGPIQWFIAHHISEDS